jgi:hypothetical protein
MEELLNRLGEEIVDANEGAPQLFLQITMKMPRLQTAGE